MTLCVCAVSSQKVCFAGLDSTDRGKAVDWNNVLLQCFSPDDNGNNAQLMGRLAVPKVAIPALLNILVCICSTQALTTTAKQRCATRDYLQVQRVELQQKLIAVGTAIIAAAAVAREV
jgi:hypothetical protein